MFFVIFTEELIIIIVAYSALADSLPDTNDGRQWLTSGQFNSYQKPLAVAYIIIDLIRVNPAIRHCWITGDANKCSHIHKISHNVGHC